MKQLLLIFAFLVSATSCRDAVLGSDPGNSPVDTFDEFWKGVALTWPAFETKNVNWDSLYTVYRPQVDVTTNNFNLNKVLTSLLYNLKDSHTTIYPKGAPTISYYPRYPTNFYGINWIRRNYPSNYKGNQAISYGLLNSDVGYIYIGSFGNSSSQYQLIDNILAEFGDVKGVIIDVRGNTGGSSANSETIASRFTDQKRTYGFARYRVNREKNNLSEFFPAEIYPGGATQFKNKVAVLSNRYSYSATEDFLLMMKVLPQTIILGDFTGGGSESRPILKELPNGWTYRVSSRLSYDADKKLISAGVRPDLVVQTIRPDSVRGKDSIIEQAILEVLK